MTMMMMMISYLVVFLVDRPWLYNIIRYEYGTEIALENCQFSLGLCSELVQILVVISLFMSLMI